MPFLSVSYSDLICNISGVVQVPCDFSKSSPATAQQSLLIHPAMQPHQAFSTLLVHNMPFTAATTNHQNSFLLSTQLTEQALINQGQPSAKAHLVLAVFLVKIFHTICFVTIRRCCDIKPFGEHRHQSRTDNRKLCRNQLQPASQPAPPHVTQRRHQQSHWNQLLHERSHALCNHFSRQSSHRQVGNEVRAPLHNGSG